VDVRALNGRISPAITQVDLEAVGDRVGVDARRQPARRVRNIPLLRQSLWQIGPHRPSSILIGESQWPLHTVIE